MAAVIVAPTMLLIHIARSAVHDPYLAFAGLATTAAMVLGVAGLLLALEMRKDQP